MLMNNTITDTGGDEHVHLNPNLLIEIGTAMAFYGATLYPASARRRETSI